MNGKLSLSITLKKKCVRVVKPLHFFVLVSTSNDLEDTDASWGSSLENGKHRSTKYSCSLFSHALEIIQKSTLINLHSSVAGTR